MTEEENKFKSKSSIRKTGAEGPCCFFMKYGKCEPPRGFCRFLHDKVDDGVTPCCFGATCRLGHASRVITNEMDTKAKLDYWKEYNKGGNYMGDSPALRDATLLRSQLEPWPTAVLRRRLVESFNQFYQDLDGLARAEIMERLLNEYKYHQRKMIYSQGVLVSQEIQLQLIIELEKWKTQHQKNTRPSIDAKSYMILRSPMEFQQKQDSNNAKHAAKKLQTYKTLWDLAEQALREVDQAFADNFSALAVTYGFTGSPHIDKQNTAPFYGMSLGSFPEGQGGVCVEVDTFTVCHVNTKNRLGKVDGRYPHWVAPYDSDVYERYSLIYYSTWQEYEYPQQAYYS